MHDGVDVSAIQRAPVVDAHAAFWLPAGASLVGNVAALAPHKGQRHLVAAAARVVAELPDVRFLIVGEGELHEALARQIKDLGLDRHVFLTGFRTDVLGLMRSLDLFVMSSVTEGLGSAVLDAMAMGHAVVGTEVGGIPEAVVPYETGLLVDAANPKALANAIVKLLKNPALRKKYGDAGRKRVAEHFGVDRLVEGTLEVYQRVAGR